MSTYLDFEEPLKSLEEQIAQTKELGESTHVDMSEQLAELEQVLQEKTKEVFSGLTPWQRVQLSRHPDRPYTLAYIDAITDGQFIELHGDRSVKDDKAMVGGFGMIDWLSHEYADKRISVRVVEFRIRESESYRFEYRLRIGA